MDNQTVRHWPLWATIVVGLILILFPSGENNAFAGELSISGKQDAIVLEAKEVPISEVLAALKKSLNLHYRIPQGSLNTIITGRYEGPLKRVLATMLQGTDYILRSGPEGSMLTVFGRNAEVPTRGPRTGAVTPLVPQGNVPGSPGASQKEAAPQLAPELKRLPPPTYPNEGMNYPAGTNFGKGL